MPNKIVVGTDLTSRSEIALQRALRIAAVQQAEVTVVHATDPLPEPWFDQVEGKLRAVVNATFARIESLAAKYGVPVKTICVDGAPADALSNTAADLSANLIVTGAHGGIDAADPFGGSTPAKVVRNGVTPTLIARTDPEVNYRSMLSLVDFSDECARAADVGRALLDPAAKAWLLHCFAVPPALRYANEADGIAEAASRLLPEIESDARTKLDKFAADHDLADATALVEIGNPATLATHIVTELGINLVTMGTQSKGPVRRMVVGSVAQAVIHRVQCDVLTVPPGIEFSKFARQVA